MIAPWGINGQRRLKAWPCSEARKPSMIMVHRPWSLERTLTNVAGMGTIGVASAVNVFASQTQRYRVRSRKCATTYDRRLYRPLICLSIEDIFIIHIFDIIFVIMFSGVDNGSLQARCTTRFVPH
jgi:hypothetical protein